jgi:hypothetical protein
MVKKNPTAAAGKTMHCPYCDKAVQDAKLPWCKSCGVKLQICTQCGQTFSSEITSCPKCGKQISKNA